MKNQDRVRETEHKFSPDLWEKLDDLKSSNIEILIEALEKYISNGFFGAAAEISDTLESSTLLNNNLTWRIRVELERMKRYYSLGYDKLLLIASNRVIEYLSSISPEEIDDDVLLWKGTAIGHKGWIISSPEELKEIIKQCIVLRDKFQNKDDKKERTCFIYALEGRLHYLEKEYKKADQKFENAINLADENNFRRSSAHIKIIYAQHLAMHDKWKEAIIYTDKFLLNAGELQFKTHLLIRAYIILFKAPDKILERKKIDLKENIFKYQILLYAMGLSQSQNLNPLLAEAKDLIPKSRIFDLYTINFREELKKRLLEITSDISGLKFEKFIEEYYKLKDYDTLDLETNYVALDLIVNRKDLEGYKYYEGVQVKSITRPLDVSILDDYSSKLLEAVDKLGKGENKKKINVKPITVIHWYVVDKLTENALKKLHLAVNACLGEHCAVNVINIDDLVNIILNKAEILVRLVFSEEFGIKQ